MVLYFIFMRMVKAAAIFGSTENEKQKIHRIKNKVEENREKEMG